MEELLKLIKEAETSRLQSIVSYLRTVKSDLDQVKCVSIRDSERKRQISDIIWEIDEEFINRMIKGDF